MTTTSDHTIRVGLAGKQGQSQSEGKFADCGLLNSLPLGLGAAIAVTPTLNIMPSCCGNTPKAGM